MGLNFLISKSLWANPEKWEFDEYGRFLRTDGVNLVRPVVSPYRWTFCVGDIGYITLSRLTHMQIEWARRVGSKISHQRPNQ